MHILYTIPVYKWYFLLGSKYLCHDDVCRNGDHFDEPNVWSKKLTNETRIKVWVYRNLHLLWSKEYQKSMFKYTINLLTYIMEKVKNDGKNE